jgi:adenosine deaminase
VRSLSTLPKAHVHLHLEGAMRTLTLRELSERNGMVMPYIRSYGSFAAFEATYMAACDVLVTFDDLRRLVFEVVEDAARAGAAWVEPAIYVPHHRKRLGPDEAVLEVVLDALTEAAAHYGVGAGLMMAADRTVGVDDAVEQAKLAAGHRDRGVVAFGLANDEAAFPPEPFAAAFRITRDAGLLSTPHAGELAGPQSIVGALDALGADRIQHGVRAVEDPDLVKRLADSPVCLDVCPTSNVMLSVVGSLAAHPLPALLDAGIRCSLNGDDPLLFGPGLLEEYELCRSELGLDDDRLAFLARCSIEASGAPREIKVEALAGIDRWLGSPA